MGTLSGSVFAVETECAQRNSAVPLGISGPYDWGAGK
ncbi:hypothetical protein FHS67_001210 [Aminobacter aminovorans]|jgi:hypothetical protein|uniref:Uncharacterized protein n=1 Tax=Aminobacter aminovorans TaxID=83263 RepID=A0AAC9ATD5_AMIAI|nr:hypothetical protein AA2016_6007 [Aminobacter aminovorans]MBB3704900.1 hypothetical protein [Aminobacter aminovorans]